jgi:sortase B
MNQSRNPYEQPNRSDAMRENRYRRPAEPDYGSPDHRNAAPNARRNAYQGRQMLRGAAGRADHSAEHEPGYTEQHAYSRHSTDRDDIAAILEEVEAKRHTTRNSEPRAEYSSRSSDVSARARVPRDAADHVREMPKAAAAPTGRRNPRAYTMPAEDVSPEAELPQQMTEQKKKHTFSGIIKNFIPWKGDSPFEVMRKTVFSLALVVVGVCAFLISSYYIDLYKGKKEYENWNKLYEEAEKNRLQDDGETVEETITGEMTEYLELNELADWLKINPDFVGYINIPGTVVSYPVVQRKVTDPNELPNNYYLYRTFKQEENRAGCIFMDYRNHFDEVVDHRRVVENSGNIFVYGHNMNNRTMFGSLRDYINNPYFYSEHPIVEFNSPYNHYKFKIFSVFIVDGEDLDSKYAYDCWNTLDFEDENAFYDYVNEAKKRTLICNDVDVKYGDQLLSLYTCNGLVENAKLILMCREVRAGEDLTEGTKNATLNDNVLYPTAYYDAGRPENYDPKKFVPYGPKS